MSSMSIPQPGGNENIRDGRPYGFKRLLDDVKEQVPLDALANDLGAGLSRNGDGLRGRGVCHGGENPTSLMVRPEEKRWWCFRCDEGGDHLDLWMKANGIPDHTDALMDLAGTYAVEPTPRPESFRSKQARQKPVRDELEKVRVRSVHRRMFRIFVRNTLQHIQDMDERQKEAERIWDDLQPIARMLVARGGGA